MGELARWGCREVGCREGVMRMGTGWAHTVHVADHMMFCVDVQLCFVDIQH